MCCLYSTHFHNSCSSHIVNTFYLVFYFYFLSSCTRNLAHKSQCCKYTLTEPHAPTMHVTQVWQMPFRVETIEDWRVAQREAMQGHSRGSIHLKVRGKKLRPQRSNNNNGLKWTIWGCYGGCQEWHAKTRPGTNTCDGKDREKNKKKNFGGRCEKQGMATTSINGG